MDEQTRVAELKKQIDAMSRGSVSALAVLEGGGPVIPRGSGDYFADTLKARGGFTPEISRRIGWGD
jgi:hypothetical protein